MKVPPVMLHLPFFVALVGNAHFLQKFTDSTGVLQVNSNVPDSSAFLNRDGCIKILKGFPHSSP